MESIGTFNKMSFFSLFLSDFKTLIKNKRFTSEENVHPVMYIEDDTMIIFYKPVDYIVYRTVILKEGLPPDIDIENLKREFNAWELPSRPDKPKQFNGMIE